MSHAYQTIRDSSAWDERYSLPLCPELNNPSIYSAYALKIMRAKGLLPGEELALCENFESFANQCQIKPGLYNRWPDRSGGVDSHDELMGRAYWSPRLARDIVHYLSATDGIYCNIPEELEKNPAMRFNLYRFPWLMPYLKAAAGYNVSVLSQLIWAGHLIIDAFTYKAGSKDDCGGRLRIWLMLEAMDDYLICRLATKFWISKMKSKDCHLWVMLSVEPREYPVFASESPKEWM